MNRIFRSSIFLVLSAFLIATSAGCSTLSSLGLPFGGSHRMLKSAEEISQSNIFPADIPAELSKQVLADYILEPGDSVLVEAARFDSPARFPGDQTIKPDGTINLGKYGELMIAGKTIGLVQAEVQSMVENYERNEWERTQAEEQSRRDAEQPGVENELDGFIGESPQRQPEVGPIVARLVSWESKGYYVLGEVNSPGRFQLNGNETVLDAIVQAGDLTNRANYNKIIISRPTDPCGARIVLPVCYRQIVQLGDTSTNYQIRPGDRVFVATMTFCDDLKETFGNFGGADRPCPACGPPQRRAAIPPVNCAEFCGEEIIR